MPPADPCARSDGGVRSVGGRENTRRIVARHREGGLSLLAGLFPRPFTLTEKILLFCLIGLLVCDVATTTYAVGMGIGYEGNPVMTGVTGCPPLHLLLKLAYAGVVVGLGGVADRYVPGAGVYCIGAACAFYVLPLVNNFWVIATCSPV
ncbi:hypothetical protein RJ40_00340 [Methanofollis aquaemaris]|uniref:DUF5658 domain-containing protein n=1 Tax=Methanofollis aquaemaris TaxID=126734 RepID=A0A8A3RZT8_9EURY|nr:DUF5658 family protein [Methanofollis aquaemaris]QSZ66057.1 hypothetical protein RJ40_00340 [Methanofollis aquaemaris]